MKKVGEQLRAWLTPLFYRVARPDLYHVHRAGGIPKLYPRLSQPWLRALGLRTVLDIGANVGQFAATIHAALPEARIVSFEPLPDCYRQLQRTMAGAVGFSAVNLALGDITGSLSFQRSSFSDSSSFLPMAEAHRRLFPFTRATHETQVRAARLDDIALSLHLEEPLLIKIDVQGYEERVLRGGERTVRCASVLIVETGFVELYEGQPLFDAIYGLLSGWGFRYHGSIEQLVSPDDGRVLQENSVFLQS